MNTLMTLSIVDYMNSPRKAIIGFYNPHEKKILLTYSHSVIWFLMTQLRLLRENRHSNKEFYADRDKLLFGVFESCDDYIGHAYGKYRLTHYREYLEERGYTLYNSISPLLLRPTCIVTSSRNNKGFVPTVFLLTQRYAKIKVKEFDMVSDADDFLKTFSVLEMLKIATKK